MAAAEVSAAEACLVAMVVVTAAQKVAVMVAVVEVVDAQMLIGACTHPHSDPRPAQRI